MNELLPFDSDLHEDLFKLMILASNDSLFDGLSSECILFEVVHSLYSFQFNDRSIAPVDFEGWMSPCAKKTFEESNLFRMDNFGYFIEKKKTEHFSKKTTVRFED